MRTSSVDVKVLLAVALALVAGPFSTGCSSSSGGKGGAGSGGTVAGGGQGGPGSGGAGTAGTGGGGVGSGGTIGGSGGTGGAPLPPDVMTGEQTMMVGNAGGTLSMDGASLVIPAGALTTDVAITIRRWTNPLPAPINGYSPRYEFLPDGTTFRKAVSLTLPFVGGADARLFMSAPAGGWEDHGGKVNGTTVTAPVTHFSSGGVGGMPVCPTQGGNTYCGAIGPGWLCCYAADLDPNAAVSYCYDKLHDPDHCGGCDPFFKCAATQFCLNIGGSPACVDCDQVNCLPQ